MLYRVVKQYSTGSCFDHIFSLGGARLITATITQRTRKDISNNKLILQPAVCFKNLPKRLGKWNKGIITDIHESSSVKPLNSLETSNHKAGETHSNNSHSKIPYAQSCPPSTLVHTQLLAHRACRAHTYPTESIRGQSLPPANESRQAQRERQSFYISVRKHGRYHTHLMA